MKMKWKKVEEKIFIFLMYASAALVLGSLFFILATVVWKGFPALDLDMVTRIPTGGYYMGEQGGVLNAIIGSLYLAGGATLLAFTLSLPIAIFLNVYAFRTTLATCIRLSLDVLWGIPSIIYGICGFAMMLLLGMRASLLGGIIALALLEVPIMVRGMDEAIAMAPLQIKESSFALGATRWETAFHVLLRQTAPGLITAVLLAFGRGIGDAASVLFTAGYTDRIPDSLLSPAASLPLAVFFQLGTPFPAVQERAYASALILTLIVLVISIFARLFTKGSMDHVVR
jgi:phosphate transport system permease protein